MALEIGTGITVGTGITISGVLNPLTVADVYYPMQTIIGSTANNVAIGSLTNYGSGGAAYNASSLGGDPVVATVNGRKVLYLDWFSGKVGYNINSTFVLPNNASLFIVGTAAGDRLIGFGGQYQTYQNCFFGYGAGTNTEILFRDTQDRGLTLSGLTSVSGLKAFGLVRTGNTVTYYDNTTTPASISLFPAETFGFNTVGYRYYGAANQRSTGYLGDLAYYSYALSQSDAATVITTLKTLYGIA